MQIDFFTLGAQIVNFFILVLLMRRFLYPRIIGAMNQREKKIALRLEEAEQKKNDALAEAESYQKLKNELSGERERMLVQVRQEVQTLRKELLESARTEVEANKTKWHEGLQHEKEEFLKDMRRQAVGQVFALARRALRDLADTDLEDRIIKTLINRLQHMKEGETQAIKQSVAGTGEIVIKSAFEIPEDLRQQIKAALRNNTGDNAGARFEIAPSLITGVEVEIGGTRITWSLESYLDALEQELSQAIERRAT